MPPRKFVFAGHTRFIASAGDALIDEATLRASAPVSTIERLPELASSG